MRPKRSKRASIIPTPSPSRSEYLTRKQIVDSRLRAAGWTAVPFKPGRGLSAYKNCAIEEFPTDSGPADYALCAGGQILGVVEAKKLALGPQEVLTQAERYSRGLSSSPFDFNGFHVPFLYSTNGEVIWHHDVRHSLNRSHQIAAFHTPQALSEFLGRDIEVATDRLFARPNDHPKLRPYQREANAATERAIANRKREMLVAMATGTGKTIQRMTVNLFGRNTIFNLGDEAIDEDAEQLHIPIHAFDLVIADECHRGYTASEVAIWRQTLDHFDAIKIGLTATPAAHTTAYFKDVVFRYEYERAVSEGHLVDYDVVSVSSNVRMQGVFLKEGEKVGVVDPETGARQLDLLEDERQFDTTEIEEKVTSPDSNQKILEEVKKYALAHEAEFGRFPKTLVFAVNDLPHTAGGGYIVL